MTGSVLDGVTNAALRKEKVIVLAMYSDILGKAWLDRQCKENRANQRQKKCFGLYLDRASGVVWLL